MALTDVSFTYWNGSAFVTVNANNWSGPFSGNTEDTDINAFGDTFSFIAKDESSSSQGTGTLTNINFTLNATNFANSGTWTLDWSSSTSGALPTLFDFVVALKAGPQYAYYLFKDIYLAADPNSYGNGSYYIGYTNPNNDQRNDLSHISLYGNPGTPQVPEPATMLLFGTGLAGMAGFARRKRS